MSVRPTTIYCLGEALAVVTAKDRHSLSLAESFEISTGGAECNVASHLAAFGETATMLTRLGDDPMGQRILTELTERGVMTNRIEMVAGARTGLYLKESDDVRGSRMFYYRDGSAASLMSPYDAQVWKLESDAWFHTSGITAALSTNCDKLVEVLLRRPVEPGGGSSFDVNFRPSLWVGRDASTRLLELASLADVVFVGLDEAQALWNVEKCEDIAELMPHVGHLVVKDGSREAIEFERTRDGATQVWRVDALRVEVVEPIGAGDAFAAGYLSQYFSGAAPFARLSFGHEVAAHTLGTNHDFLPMIPGDRRVKIESHSRTND